MNNKILVTGATGNFGKATIEFLLQKGVSASDIVASDIAAMVRDEEKAVDLKDKGIELRIGDYGDYSSLFESFQGIDRVLFVSNLDIAHRIEQHENVVRALRDSGVKHVIYTSYARHSDSAPSAIAAVGDGHRHTEKLIKASGLSYTIMKNSLYADLLPMFFGEKVLETGVFFPAGEGRAAFAVRRDMAEAAANLLLNNNAENKEYDISGSKSYSMEEIASILSELSGKTVPYLNPSPQSYRESLEKAGVPEMYVSFMLGFGEAIKQGEFDFPATDLEKILGRETTSLQEFLKTIYATS